mmetsp:Transcript_15746/g.28293  ORF Transcript_15746/g.28293 Transcript_15746/m.28293 type:complete len:80 (+) Transcript_15746:39-278(+)
MGAASSGTSAVDAPCQPLKKEYDECHTKWYKQEFLKGKSMELPSECRIIWDNYTSCVKKNITAKYKVKFEEEEEEGDDD